MESNGGEILMNMSMDGKAQTYHRHHLKMSWNIRDGITFLTDPEGQKILMNDGILPNQRLRKSEHLSLYHLYYQSLTLYSFILKEKLKNQSQYLNLGKCLMDK